MRNKLKYVILMTIILSLSFCSKEEKSNNNNTILGLYLLDQLSGNCVVISKNTTTTTYTATGYLVPKGGCNSSTLDSNLYTASPSEAKAGIDTYYDGLISEFVNTSTCSSLATQNSTAKNSTTVAGLTSLQNTLSSGSCTSGGFRIVNGKWGLIFLCKDDSSITIQRAKFQYLNVSSVTTDMSTKLTDLKLATSNGNSVYGFTSSAIAKMRPLNSTEYGTYTSQAFLAFIAGGYTTDCGKAILSNNSSVKSLVTSLFGKSLITDADSISEVLTYSLTCSYGSGFTEVTTAATSTTSTVVQKCPSSYPTY